MYTDSEEVNLVFYHLDAVRNAVENDAHADLFTVKCRYNWILYTTRVSSDADSNVDKNPGVFSSQNAQYQPNNINPAESPSCRGNTASALSDVDAASIPRAISYRSIPDLYSAVNSDDYVPEETATSLPPVEDTTIAELRFNISSSTSPDLLLQNNNASTTQQNHALIGISLVPLSSIFCIIYV